MGTAFAPGPALQRLRPSLPRSLRGRRTASAPARTPRRGTPARAEYRNRTHNLNSGSRWRTFSRTGAYA
eukprot:2583798-Alexandrium_andersonii.AAC.1